MEPTILIVDDSRFARLKIEGTLRRHRVCFDYLHAGDGAEAADLLAERPVDLVLCDVLMPKADGFEFLSRKREDTDLFDIPVIMLTAEEEIGVKLKCLEAGASDYLLKPFHDLELVARVRIHLQLKELRDQLRAKNETLEKLIRIDALTGVSNRLHLAECLGREFSRSRRHDLAFALAILDVDHFKSVNDRFGHLVGDYTLREIGARLTRSIRAHDTLARYGGEEFALILPQAGAEAARVTVERCRQEVSNEPFAVGDHSFRITLSAGLTSYPASGAQTEDQVLRQADQALYEAKRTGRDRLVCWKEDS